MKHKLVTFLGVVVMLGAIIVVRTAFEQSPRTDADEKASEAAETQLAEANAETATDEHAGHDHGDGDGHDHGDMDEHAHAHDGEKGGAAEGDADGAAAPVATLEGFEEIAEWPASAPDVYRVKFESSTGPFVIEVNKAWAPLGAERFYELCKMGFYDDSRYFRVLKNFVVQFGLAADPKLSMQYRERTITDDPVRKSNQRGMITFATSGPDSRTTQVFINYADNSQLDGMGFAPFGEVIAGMENVEAINGKHGQKPNQYRITQEGNEYLKSRFPDLDFIKSTTLVK